MKKRVFQRKGFTLLEVMVVVSVIGMLASLAVPYWAKASTTAQLQACVQHQRAIYDAVVLYELESGRTLNGMKSNADSIRKRLMNRGYVQKESYFECPSSSYTDYADYNLVYTRRVIEGTLCLNDPSNHVISH